MPLVLLLIGMALLGTLSGKAQAMPKAPKVRYKKAPTEVRDLAVKWGEVFQIPTNHLLAIARIESSYNENAVQRGTRAMGRGGAFGLMQVTLDTAKEIAKTLAKSTNTKVKATLAKWDGTGESLFDADLCMMFGAYYLSGFYKEFGKSFDHVAAAYHQGAQGLRDMIKKGYAIPEKLPPNGKLYVAMARDAMKGLTST